MCRLALPLAAFLALPGLPAAASEDDIVRIMSAVGVSETADALEAAIGKAGATVFARIDHGGGAASVGMELGDSELVIFGNPKLGTPAMQDAPLAGLFLPLKVLVYTDEEGSTWIAYEKPEETLDDLGISDDAPYLAQMRGALQNLTMAAAAGG
ncbi:Uncharacterized conserved protein, DUF302 family [Rhodovulum sp. ES.010]|uniref:DUF302 domain-containing protein n=1 Tax=Rhodovulum sp. ES.010 TaxID=1882821 RepID=UPI000925CC1A|nr:DUF302 domain-containing protein [Rhodovulum sp. ES.010]SIO35918.1 Uncharacterized conserved protein, DUF302 family [Rhodovulum sp. ES.010]